MKNKKQLRRLLFHGLALMISAALLVEALITFGAVS